MTQNQLSPAETAARFINQTGRNIFLTGKAGTGKTTFLRNIIKNTHKVAVIAAPTGIAAINAGGVTIHSLFQLPFGSYIPESSSQHYTHLKVTTPDSLIRTTRLSDKKRSLFRELELLIIDEVSMLRADMLDAIDRMLRHVRKKYNTAFGGVQVLFIGDLLQLPPVVKDEEWKILSQHYQGMFFFNAHVLKSNPPVYIELDKIHRQDDEVFISLLNNLRNNQLTENDTTLLNSYYKPGFKAVNGENFITLTTHNYKAQNINNEFLSSLKEKSFVFEAEVKGEFSEHIYPIDKKLELKKGAQIMFIKNDTSVDKLFFNGKIGVITSISSEEIEVTCEDEEEPILVSKYEWQNLSFELNENTNEVEEKVIGTFTQYPIKLAWAITVHKSQGLTFDKAIIDPADAFAPGQVYVALSRLRSLKGLVLTSRVNFKNLASDESVSKYVQTKNEQENPENIIGRETDHFLHHQLLQSFDLTQLEFKIRSLLNEETEEGDRTKKNKSLIKSWKETVTEFLPHSEKFKGQLHSYFTGKAEGYLNTIKERIQAAEKYFVNSLNAISTEIRAEISRNENEKKVKAYLKELAELDNTFFAHIKKIKRASLFIEAITNNKELTRQEVNEYTDQETRKALPHLSSTPERSRKRKDKKIKDKKIKEEKIPTTELTFQLYKEGKTLEEIAAERKFAVSTIEGHLAKLGEEGKIDLNALISEDKKEKILTVSKALETDQFGPIKNALGDEFSYSEIRFAIAIKKRELLMTTSIDGSGDN